MRGRCENHSQAVKRTRKRTGCLTCRLRHKKCDERKPVCVGCERNWMQCRWPTGSSRDWRTRLMDPNTTIKEAVENITQSRPKTGAEPSLTNHTPKTSDKAGGIHEQYYKDTNVQLYEVPMLTSLSFSNAYSSPSWPKILERSDLQSLFHFYLNTTAFFLTSRVRPFNPFVSYVLPYALSDDLITHCVLALGSSHFSSTHDQRPSSSTRSHYSVAVRCVRQRLKVLEGDDNPSPETLLSLILAILLLGQFEVMDGSQNGAVVLHLRASRELLLRLGRLQVERNIHGFLLELHAFMSTVSTTSVAGVKFKGLKRAAGRDEKDPLTSRLDLINRGTDSYGLLFGCAHSIFETIPIIETLRYASLTPIDLDSQDSQRNLFRYLENRIMTWEPPKGLADLITDEETASEYRVTGCIHQQAVLLYLYTSYYGVEIEHDKAAMDKIEESIDRILAASGSLKNSHPMWSSLLWSGMVLGSCLRKQEHRDLLVQALSKPPYNMFGCQQVLQVLSVAWERGYYGPIGVERVIDEQEIIMSIA